MNKFFTFLLFIACCFANGMQAVEFDLTSNSELFGEEEVIVIQKIYVEPSEIYFFNNKIFVQTQKGMIEIPSLQSDSKGIYYRAIHPYHWTCDYCKEYNTYTYYCERCGRAPKGK